MSAYFHDDGTPKLEAFGIDANDALVGTVKLLAQQNVEQKDRIKALEAQVIPRGLIKAPESCDEAEKMILVAQIYLEIHKEELAAESLKIATVTRGARQK